MSEFTLEELKQLKKVFCKTVGTIDNHLYKMINKKIENFIAIKENNHIYEVYSSIKCLRYMGDLNHSMVTMGSGYGDMIDMERKCAKTKNEAIQAMIDHLESLKD